MSQTETPPAATSAIPPDPLVVKSYSVPIAIAMLAVVGATVLALVDEMWLRRPYKAIQGRYAETYTAYLEKVEAKRRDFFDNVLTTKIPEYTALKEKAAQAAAACAEAEAVAAAALETATQQSRSLGSALKEAKSEIAALTYESEHKAHGGGHAKVEDSPDARPVVDEIEQVRAREITYSWPVSKAEMVADDKGGRTPRTTTTQATESGKVGELLVKAAGLEEEKARLQTELGKAGTPKSEAAKARDQWLADNLGNLAYVVKNCDDATRKRIAASGAAAFLDREAVVLTPGVIASMREKVAQDFASGFWAYFDHSRGINQIHIAAANNWVDRCVTCHLNSREPLPVTVDSLRDVLGQTVNVADPAGGEPRTLDAWPKEKIDAMPLDLFTSHPNPALLKTHDPDRFGCSMCHNGNGVAITSTELAHGENHDWLMPLFPKANVEAGCVQCHQKDLVVPMAERLNAGRDRFRRSGCWGCHKYEGFNRELDEITALVGRRKDVDTAIESKKLRSENLRALLGALADDETAMAKDAPANQAERDALTQEISSLTTEGAQIDKRLRAVHVERQRVGPNLKDLKVKLKREFLTDWIRSPRDAHKDSAGNAFRPDTKMPTFRWWGDADEEVKDVAAFLWQSALDPSEFPEYKLPQVKAGDAKRGQELFEKTGCLACHSMGTGKATIGSDYAANLSNLAEKDTPEYVARWINHPRKRLVAFDPVTQKDVKDADPDDPRFVWTQQVIMPNFRLSEAEVADITAYLMSQKRADVKYEEPTWLDDKDRLEKGRKLVLYQGCAGCHEIRGLEGEKGIGTELTPEGSKPLDRLDFGHLTIAAKRGTEPLKGATGLLEDAATLFAQDTHWYRQRGFFLHKLAKPDVYDESKYLPDRFNRLRMPQFKFSAQEILDVTTLLLGSVETKIPETFRYRPEGRAKAIQEGWWVVKKYNCQGCHQVEPADSPAIWKAPFFAQKLTENGGRDLALPPTLVGVGFRLRPEFVARFLRDPSLGGGREHPKSVRAHLPIRMPTFDFSDDEIEKLVLFFQAIADQPTVYQPPVMKPLSAAEKTAAAAIWKSANCMQCHVIDGMAVTSETKAPNLTYAPQRLRPEWSVRWISNPPAMNPHTAMTKFFGDNPGPGGKWVFMTPLPELKGITVDHAELMARYVAEGLAGK